jgi:hypothetical protein
MTTGEFGLECRCDSELKDCSVVTVGLFSGLHELFDVKSVACGPCVTKGLNDNDDHAMPMRIVKGSFDYQDHPTQPQQLPQPLPQPLPQVSKSLFVNEPVIKTEESAPFFGKIVPISGEKESEEDDKFVEFCTNLDTSTIIDSDWEERGGASHSKGKQPGTRIESHRYVLMKGAFQIPRVS